MPLGEQQYHLLRAQMYRRDGGVLTDLNRRFRQETPLASQCILPVCLHPSTELPLSLAVILPATLQVLQRWRLGRCTAYRSPVASIGALRH